MYKHAYLAQLLYKCLSVLGQGMRAHDRTRGFHKRTWPFPLGMKFVATKG